MFITFDKITDFMESSSAFMKASRDIQDCMLEMSFE